MPMKRIAARLGVSPSSVSLWTRDIELTPEQRHRNLYGPGGPQNPANIAGRNEKWRAKCRNRRLAAQTEGRVRARIGNALHLAGCMLYWAEGAKARNVLNFANSELSMVKLFVRFLRECLAVTDDRITLRLNVYTGNGLTLEAIEDHWLDGLQPRGARFEATPSITSRRRAAE